MNPVQEVAVEDMLYDELHEAVVDRAKRLAQMEPQVLTGYIAALLELQVYGHRCGDIWAEPRDGEDTEREEFFEGTEGQGWFRDGERIVAKEGYQIAIFNAMSWQTRNDIDVKEYQHWKENGYAFSVASPSELTAEHLAREEAARPRPDKEKIMNTRLEQMTCGDTIRARGGVRCLGHGEDGTMHFEVESESHDKLYRVRIHVQGRGGIRCLGYDGDGVMRFEGEPEPLDETYHFRMYSGPEGTVEDGTIIADCECEDFRHAAGALGYVNAHTGDTDGLDVFILDDLPLCQHIWAALGQNDITKEQELIRLGNRVKAREGRIIKANGWNESRYYPFICVEDIRRMRVEGWVFTVASSAEWVSLAVLNDHPLNWL